MSKKNGIKWLGIAATVGGVGITLLNNFVSEKQQDEKIDRKVQEAVAKLTKKGE